MSTRGLFGFVADGQLKVAYNHFDSYPGGLGTDVLGFVRQLVKDGVVAEAKARAVALKVIDDEASEPRPEDVVALRPWTNLHVDQHSGPPSWYQLLRETQGNPDAVLSSGYIVDGVDFGRDSLFCEWGYVIDFDARALEVYRGFQEKPPTAGRWKGKAPSDVRSSQYYPIEQVAVLSFDDLPEDDAFLRLFDSEE